MFYLRRVDGGKCLSLLSSRKNLVSTIAEIQNRISSNKWLSCKLDFVRINIFLMNYIITPY